MEEVLKLFIEWTKVKVRLHMSEPKIYFLEREIWWVSLGVNIGVEKNGKNENFERPVLIFKKFNRSMFLGIPLTGKPKINNRYYIKVKYPQQTSYLVLSHIRLLSSKRLLRKIHTLSKEEFLNIQYTFKDMI